MNDELWFDGYEQWKKKMLETAATPAPTPEKTKCILHDPETYVGFTDTFVYCRICDAKKKGDEWVS